MIRDPGSGNGMENGGTKIDPHNDNGAASDDSDDDSRRREESRLVVEALFFPFLSLLLFKQG
jgi:hypothetical protein